MLRSSRRISLLLTGFCILLISITGIHAYAQEITPQVTLFPLNSADFPLLSAYLDAHSPTGHFIRGLRASDVQILEDSNPVPVDTLEELHPGVQFVIAIAPGPAFDIRDTNGVSRFEYLLQGIYTWSYQPDQEDDLSLVTSWTSEIAHVDQPSRILAGLSSYPVTGSPNVPDLQVLSRAMEIVSQPTRRPGMERVILFITASQAAEGVVGLQSFASQASELGIRIYVWVLGSQEFFTQPESAPLRAISGQTLGQFYAFTGAEAVPDLEEILEPLRYIYALTYTSRLTTSGSHQALAQVAIEGTSISSNAQNFDVSILPPQPVIESLPDQIQRAVPSQARDSTGSNMDIALLPAEQPISLTVSFPDGYVRPLVRTTLYVDGAIADENTVEPFDEFTWDLRTYLDSQDHLVKVEAVDNLGMSGMSPETVVRVNVTPLERNILAALMRNKLLITGIVVVLAGAILSLVLILGGKIRPPHPAQVRKTKDSRTTNPITRPRHLDPVTQPLSASSIPASASATKKQSAENGHLRKSHHKERASILAYLVPLVEAGEPTILAPQSLHSEEVLLGSDPNQVAIDLSDASVQAVHVLLQWQDGTYHLFDKNTVAGTWVNYAQVSSQGVRLEHGDLIYAGRVGFRFHLKNPGPLPKPYVRIIQKPQ